MTNTEIIAMLKELGRVCRCETCKYSVKHQYDAWWWCRGAPGGGGGHLGGFGCFDWQPYEEEKDAN